MAEQIDYTETLQLLSNQLHNIETQLTYVNFGQASNDVASITDVNDSIFNLQTAIQNMQNATTVDYTAQIQSLQKLLAWTDLLLIVLVVVLFLFVGLVLGGQVTQWMKRR